MELFLVWYYTTGVDAEFYVTKPRLQNNLVWCGKGLRSSSFGCCSLLCYTIIKMVTQKQAGCYLSEVWMLKWFALVDKTTAVDEATLQTVVQG